jgi:hypothetical protein
MSNSSFFSFFQNNFTKKISFKGIKQYYYNKKRNINYLIFKKQNPPNYTTTKKENGHVKEKSELP